MPGGLQYHPSLGPGAAGRQEESTALSNEPSSSGAQESGFPHPAYAWYVLFVLFFAYVVSFLDRQILTLLVEPIKSDLELTDTMLSLLHGFTFAIFYHVKRDIFTMTLAPFYQFTFKIRFRHF